MESEKRKLQGRIKKVDAELASYKKEHETIHKHFMSDSMSWSKERHERYEELTKLIEGHERLWLELTDKLEAS